jgi:hypothetical protein
MALNIDDLRKRILAGGSYTREELREAIAALRGERVAVATNTTAKRQATKGMSDDELDDDFMSIVAQVQEEKK